MTNTQPKTHASIFLYHTLFLAQYITDDNIKIPAPVHLCQTKVSPEYPPSLDKNNPIITVIPASIAPKSKKVSAKFSNKVLALVGVEKRRNPSITPSMSITIGKCNNKVCILPIG